MLQVLYVIVNKVFLAVLIKFVDFFFFFNAGSNARVQNLKNLIKMNSLKCDYDVS